MDPADLLLLRELEAGIPLVPRPYAALGEQTGMSEDEVIRRISSLQEDGLIRRLRARINQRSLGIIANALVAWKVPADQAASAGAGLAAMPGVTHCYRRTPVPGRWEYTHYTVHHGWTHEAVMAEITEIGERTGLSEYLVLFSTREYKRIPHTRSGDIRYDP